MHRYPDETRSTLFESSDVFSVIKPHDEYFQIVYDKYKEQSLGRNDSDQVDAITERKSTGVHPHEDESTPSFSQNLYHNAVVIEYGDIQVGINSQEIMINPKISSQQFDKIFSEYTYDPSSTKGSARYTKS